MAPLPLLQQVIEGSQDAERTTTSSRITAQHDMYSKMVKLIFALADEDRDGYLKHADCSNLARRTENPAGLPEKEYIGLCKVVDVKPEIGLQPKDLFRVYCELQLGDLSKDFELMGFNSRLESAVEQATANELRVVVAEGGAGVVCDDLMVVTKVTSGSACDRAAIKAGDVSIGCQWWSSGCMVCKDCPKNHVGRSETLCRVCTATVGVYILHFLS